MALVNNKAVDEPVNTLLEQYKLYVEMADRTSARRGETNKFYISLLTLLVALGPLIQFTITLPYGPVTLRSILIPILGLGLCVVWAVNIRAYRHLNAAKYEIIQSMEEHLTYDCYRREWGIVTARRSYTSLTKVEYYVPGLLLLAFLTQLIVSVWR